MNIGFISLGCAKNRVDTEIMMGILKKDGHKIVADPGKADLVIINTCGFIQEAKEEAINNIIDMGKLKQSDQLRYLIATGCLAQRFGQDLLHEMPELDGVVGISSFTGINLALNKVISGEKVCMVSPPAEIYFEQGPRVLTTPPGLAYLKIAEGCNNRCSYCAIPGIRGALRSRPVIDIEKEARYLVASGIRELVIIAQDLGDYGTDLSTGDNLPELINRLNLIEGDFWIRLMYVHPIRIDDRIIQAINNSDKVVPYIDLPIQHANSKILKSMNRKHDKDYLWSVLEKLRRNIKDLVLRTTAMVGYPGETEQEFEELADFVQQAQFDWLGAFKYVAEEGTAAARLENQVSDSIKKDRYQHLLKVQAAITRKKNISRIGTEQSILISSRADKNLYLGRGYFQAPEVDGITLIKSAHTLKPGEFYKVKLSALRRCDMIGEVINEYSQ
ncbi:MAG: 30S ribosomal protein S12 methylthiotransferase RimO [Syntrophomonadaceae bacterium]|nr:30S ribosomal protein S12 methylthiotransferase RimO [Syntrophomonadaceae bacterium]